MDILVWNSREDTIDHLTFMRLQDTVRVLHRGKPVADVPVRDLLNHLARRSTRRWVQRRRRWHDLEIALTPGQKVVLAVRHRISTNTLTTDELQALLALLATDADSSTPKTGAAQHGGAWPPPEGRGG